MLDDQGSTDTYATEAEARAHATAETPLVRIVTSPIEDKPPTREQIAEVPVALLRMTIDSLKSSQDDGRARAKQLEALLPQPTPSAEQIETLRQLACDGSGVCQSPLHAHGCYSDLDGSACDEPTEHPSAEPVSIADMAPGATDE